MSNRARKNEVEVQNEERSETAQDMKMKKAAQSNTKAAMDKKSTKKNDANAKSKKATGKSKTAKPGKAVKNPPVNKEGGEQKERYFKLIDAKTGGSYGRYTGDTPKQAASKGYTKMLQKLKSEGKQPPKQATIIYLRESTRGSARKIYGYEASRQKLPEPQELVITDKETGEEKTIVYHYRNRIKKVPVPEQIGGAMVKPGKKGATMKRGAGSKKGSAGKSKAAGDKGGKKMAPKSGSKKGAKAAPKKGAAGKKPQAKAVASR